MHRSEQISNRRRLMSLQHQVARRVKVSQALRHLLALDQQKTHVKPEAGERFSGEGFRLRDLVLVMREDKILASGVQIKTFAQLLHRHNRALQVPAGPSRPDRGIPESLTRLGCLPERKIARAVFVVLVHIHTSAIQHSAEILLRELPVLRKTSDAK